MILNDEGTKERSGQGKQLFFGARLCEPQRVNLQIERLRVTDPRSTAGRRNLNFVSLFLCCLISRNETDAHHRRAVV